MKFTKEQQDYLKHCGEHFEVLTGGRGHSKTKEVIEDMQQEIERLNNIMNELEKDIDNQITFCTNEANGTTNDKYCRIALNYLKHLKDKLQELKDSGKE